MWTTFPTFFDIEYDGLGYQEAPFTLVSFKYGEDEKQLPDVHKFFRV